MKNILPLVLLCMCLILCSRVFSQGKTMDPNFNDGTRPSKIIQLSDQEKLEIEKSIEISKAFDKVCSDIIELRILLNQKGNLKVPTYPSEITLESLLKYKDELYNLKNQQY